MPGEHPRRWKVEPVFAGQTIAVLGAGPSLNAGDVERVRAAGWPMVAVNNALELAPDAAVHFFTDVRWHRWYGHSTPYRSFAGIRATLENWDLVARDPGLRPLLNHGREGLCFAPGRICNGGSSGYAAMNLALQLGAVRLVLLGFDMQPVGGRTHFFGDHPTATPPEVYALMLSYFPTMRAELQARHLEVVNCTPGSALTTFPIRPLSEIVLDAHRVLDAQG